MGVLHQLRWWQGALLAVAAAQTNAFAAETVPPLAPEEPLFAAPTQVDRIGRILAPVMVNGRGPFRFLLDTGANHSTVSPQLVSTLGLEAATNRDQMLHGVTGSAPVPTVLIDRIETGTLLLEKTYVPIVGTLVNADADGILGVAGMQHARVVVDFRRDKVLITRSRLRTDVGRGYFVIYADRMNDGLLVVKSIVHGVRTQAVIDTGAQRTLGNSALRDAVRNKVRNRSEPREADVYGATLDVARGEYDGTSTVHLGELSINHVSITYGDFHIFDTWHLQDRPAMLIGMDVLGVADELVFDFQQRLILIKRAN